MKQLDPNRLRPEQELAGPIPAEALAFLRAKKIKPGFSHEDVWHEEHRAAFTAAKFMERDVLDALKQAVTVALQTGQTLRDFQRGLKDKLAEMGWWGRREVVDPKTGQAQVIEVGAKRLELIYDTNLRTARAAGQWQRIERTKKLRPYLQYGLGPSKVHRDQHVAWNGIILPVDHEFWHQAMPPSGYNCKCHVRQITAREADRLGGVTENFEFEYVESKNKRTGEVVRHIKGIDPSFAFNPGLDRFAGLREAAK